MKIVEIDAKTFDKFAVTEPDYNIYHTAEWHELFKNPKNEYLYLTYQDDMGFIYGFALTELSKKSFFSKTNAVIQNGFLTNFYDFELLKNFNDALITYLKAKGVKSLTITPNILYKTRFGENDYLIKKLEELGYQKTNDSYVYFRDFTDERMENDEKIVLNFKELLDDELDQIEKQFGYSLKRSKECLKDRMHVLATTLDIENTIRNYSLASIENSEDTSLKDTLAVLEKMKEDYNNDPVLEYICYLTASKKVYVLFTDQLNTELDIHTNIWADASDDLKKKGYIGFSSTKHFKDSVETACIGEFTTSF